jgi:hypothetical protein
MRAFIFKASLSMYPYALENTLNVTRFNRFKHSFEKKYVATAVRNTVEILKKFTRKSDEYPASLNLIAGTINSWSLSDSIFSNTRSMLINY